MNDGGPAFPRAAFSHNNPSIDAFDSDPVDGMSLRDWFAGMALQGLTACTHRTFNPEALAKDSFIAADAMIAEREKHARKD